MLHHENLCYEFVDIHEIRNGEKLGSRRGNNKKPIATKRKESPRKRHHK